MHERERKCQPGQAPGFLRRWCQFVLGCWHFAGELLPDCVKFVPDPGYV